MRFLLASTAAALVLTTGAGAENHASADTVVATVGDTEITLGHMIVLKQRLPQEYQSLPAPIIWEGVLDQLVQQTLLGQSIDGLSAGSQATLDNEARALRASEAIVEIAEAAVTEEAVAAAYAESVARQEGQQEWNVDHILFQPQDGDEEGAARARAEQAIADLDGGADFAELARERSTGPSGPSGGALGWAAKGAFVPEFEEAMIALDPGAHSAEPVQTRFGWHVIRLNEVRTLDAPPLEQVRPQIEEMVRREAIDAAVADLQAQATITRTTPEEIDPALLDNLDLLEGR